MKIWKTVSIVMTLLICGGVVSSSLPKHLRDAQMLVDHISPKFNDYQHKGCYIKWEGEGGAIQYENRSDCSDFLALLLEHSYGIGKQQYKQWTGLQRPFASEWHKAIVAGKGFDQIIRLADAKPGDVLAVKFPPNMADTGHIMLMAAAPVSITPKAPLVQGTKQWNVTIIDSTKSAHGASDTRYISEGNSNPGVGRGVIRIYTNTNGSVAGYTWSDGSKAKFESMSDRNLAIGRLKMPL